MIGAVATHVIHGEWGMLALAGTIMALAAWRAFSGRTEIGALSRRLAAA